MNVSAKYLFWFRRLHPRVGVGHFLVSYFSGWRLG